MASLTEEAIPVYHYAFMLCELGVTPYRVSPLTYRIVKE